MDFILRLIETKFARLIVAVVLLGGIFAVTLYLLMPRGGHYRVEVGPASLSGSQPQDSTEAHTPATPAPIETPLLTDSSTSDPRACRGQLSTRRPDIHSSSQLRICGEEGPGCPLCRFRDRYQVQAIRKSSCREHQAYHRTNQRTAGRRPGHSLRCLDSSRGPLRLWIPSSTQGERTVASFGPRGGPQSPLGWQPLTSF